MSADSVTVLGHGALPKAEPASFDQMIRAETDCKLVTVRAIIRTADQTSALTPPHYFMRLQLIMDGGYIDADVSSEDAGAFEGLLDAEVEMTGIASEKFDSKMHQTGINCAGSIDCRRQRSSSAPAPAPWLFPLRRWIGSSRSLISAIPRRGYGFMEASPITCPVQPLSCRTAPRAFGSIP